MGVQDASIGVRDVYIQHSLVERIGMHNNTVDFNICNLLAYNTKILA